MSTVPESVYTLESLPFLVQPNDETVQETYIELDCEFGLKYTLFILKSMLA